MRTAQDQRALHVVVHILNKNFEVRKAIIISTGKNRIGCVTKWVKRRKVGVIPINIAKQ